MTKWTLFRHILINTLLIVAICTAASTHSAQDGMKEVTINRQWVGKFKGKDRASLERLRAEAPAKSFITKPAQWAKLWKAWRGDEKLPDVDFQKELVLVYTTDPVNSFAPKASLDEDGNLTMTLLTTLVAVPITPEFAYCLAVIERDGIKTINGEPLEGR